VGPGVAATSPDGITWTRRTLPAGNWRDITYGNGVFVAVGDGGSATSPDGITWTPRILPANAVWLGVTYGNGVFVAVSSFDGGFATSPDGITWTRRSPPSELWWSVTYGNGVFVAVGRGSIAAVSSNRGEFVNISGGNFSSLVLAGLMSENDKDQYRAIVDATNATRVTSNAATLTVSGS
jgi:hypothetical protein